MFKGSPVEAEACSEQGGTGDGATQPEPALVSPLDSLPTSPPPAGSDDDAASEHTAFSQVGAVTAVHEETNSVTGSTTQWADLGR